MTRDEHRAAIQQLHGMIAPEHVAAASALLTNLSDDYGATLTTSEQATANVTRLTEENDKLLKANGRLFMQVGQTKQESHKEDKPEQKEEQEENKLTFEALFNKEGELI